jgi:hypothetical protein
MINLTFEERERFWYGIGTPFMATSDDIDLIQWGRELKEFKAENDIDLADVPARLEQAATDASERDAYREALETVAANFRQFPMLCNLIERFISTPKAVYFDRELDTVITIEFDQPE